MPIPSSISDLSQTAGSNSPAGSESPSLIDDYLRTYASYIALLRDQNSMASVTIASAATTDIGAALSTSIIVSGTTTITALGTAAAGVRRTVRFLGALVLTHNASTLILPGSLNITTAANDSAEFQSLGSGQWICLRYTLANTKPAPTVGTVSQSGGATNGALMEYGTNATGEYWKFASGLMVSSQAITLGALTWTAGVGVRYLQITAGLPVTFSASPLLYTQVRDGNVSARAAWCTIAVAPTSSTIDAWFASPAATTGSNAFAVNVLAIGKWF